MRGLARIRNMRIFRPLVLYNYIGLEYLKNLALALAVCTLVLLLIFVVVFSYEMEDFNVSVGQMAMLSPYIFPLALSYSLPLASMIGAILVFGRMAAENVILSAQTAGASIFQLSLPVLFLGMVLSGVSLWCLGVGIDWGFSTIRDEIRDG